MTELEILFSFQRVFRDFSLLFFFYFWWWVLAGAEPAWWVIFLFLPLLLFLFLSYISCLYFQNAPPRWRESWFKRHVTLIYCQPYTTHRFLIYIDAQPVTYMPPKQSLPWWKCLLSCLSMLLWDISFFLPSFSSSFLFLRPTLLAEMLSITHPPMTPPKVFAPPPL